MAEPRPIADGGRNLYDEAWLDPTEAAALYATLRDEVPWEQRSIRIAGRVVQEPRLTAWFGDPGAAYTYSGMTLSPLPWTPALSALRGRVEIASGVPLNSVLLNWYRSGSDSMGWHADAEDELGPDPVIASVSLGATRRFVLKYVGRAIGVENIELDLTGGSLLVMAGTTQRYWRHAVPKRRGDAGSRINLTFRRILIGDPDKGSWSRAAF